MSAVQTTSRRGGDLDRPGQLTKQRHAILPFRHREPQYGRGRSTHRLVREDFSAAEARLLERLDDLARTATLTVDAFADAESYRTIAHEALAMLHAAGVREASLQRQTAALRDELRRYTASQVRP